MKLSLYRNLLPVCVAAILLVNLTDVFWLHKYSLAQENHCDPTLNQLSDNPLGYRLRNGRCEGIYIKGVGSTTLMVASLTKPFEDKDFFSSEELTIKWTVPANWRVHLRAQSLRRRLHYRMDTFRYPDKTTYNWPLNILAALKIQRKDIGIVGWSRYVINGTERSIYVPLRIGHQPEADGSDCYQLVLLPGRELTEVFMSLAPLDTDGDSGAFIIDGKALEYGYYPADRGITIPICNFAKPGIYYLEFGATLRGGGTDTVELLFYYPGS